MHDVAGTAARQVRRAVGIASGRESCAGLWAGARRHGYVVVNLKWGVGEVAGERVIGLCGRGGRRTRGVAAARRQLVREADVVLQQARENATVLLYLLRATGVRTCHAVYAPTAGLQVAYAIVLVIQHRV